jgi:CheY-like chemotaxis protein
MTGTELAARLRRARIDLPIILMSGYTPADLAARGLEASLGDLLTKLVQSGDSAGGGSPGTRIQWSE